MTDEDDTDGRRAGDDPWAPGGAMSRAPIPPPAPLRFDGDPREAPGSGGTEIAPAPSSGPAAGEEPESSAASTISFEPSGERLATIGDRSREVRVHRPAAAEHLRSGDGAPVPPTRRRWIGRRPRAAVVAGGLAAAVALSVVGIWTAARDDPQGDEPAADAADASTTAPAVETTLPATLPPATDPPVVARGGSPVPRELPPDSVVPLPPELQFLAPLELLVLTGDGLLQLDLPSGNLRQLYADSALRPPQAAVTDNAAVVWGGDAGTSRMTLVPRIGAPVEIDLPGPIGRVVAERDDEFLVLVVNGEHRRLSVDPVVWTRRVEIPVGDPWSATAHPGGGVLISGDVGTYLLDGGTPQVISGGYVVAIGRNHVLTRACADGAGCTLVLDSHDGTRVELPDDLGDEVLPGTSSFTLSPDGGALTRAQFGVATGPAMRIVEVADGSTVDVPTTASSLPATIAWEPGGRGFFALVDHSVVYVDRRTGETVEVLPADDVFDIVARPAPSTSDRVAGPESAPLSLTVSGETGLDLVGVADGGVVDVDLDGRSFRLRPGLPIASGAPVFVLPDRDGVTVTSWDRVDGYRIVTGGATSIDADTLSGPILPGPVAGTAWRGRSAPGSDGVAYELVTGDGGLLGPAIELDHADLLGSDGRGGLLVSAGGGVYEAAAAGTRRLATGELLASGSGAIYVRDCDEALVCSVVRVDRMSGETIPVDHPAIVDAAADPGLSFVAGTSVSPDGDVALVRPSPDGLAWTMVDLATGTTLEVPGPASGTGLVWSADSRYAAFLSGGTLRVYDRPAATLRTVDELPRMRALAALPTDGASAGAAGPASLRRGGGSPHRVR